MSGTTLILASLAIALILAHLIGRKVFRVLSISAGHGRRIMPTVPSHQPEEQGRPGAAMRAAIRDVEAKLIDLFQGGVEAVEAAPLAAQLQTPVEWVEAALDRLRQEVPCRIRVTESGRMLHDFAAEEIAELKRRKSRAKPLKAGLFLLAICANAGTIWPVVTVLLLAGTSLAAMFAAFDYRVGLAGFFALGVVVVGTIIVGYIFNALLTPTVSGPGLGPAIPRQPTERRQSLRRHRESNDAESVKNRWTFGWFADVLLASGRRSRSSRSSSSRDGGAGQLILIIIVAILLLAVIALCLSTLFVWLRGLYRAITSDEDLSQTSPTSWVRLQERVDRLEKLLPTTDLVGRIWRALRRVLTRRRPVDGEMGRRILARAEANGGTVSSIEITLHEALDPYEAVEAGVRLCQRAGGDITVLEHGEVAFTFPDASAGEEPPEEDQNLWAEYLTFDQDGPDVRRDPAQPKDSVPVNLVGLRLGHLEGAARLVAGSWLMVVFVAVVCSLTGPSDFAAYLLESPDAASGDYAQWGYLAIGLTALFATATTVLAAVTSYTAAATAQHGLQRDARRAAFQEIMEHLDAGRGSINLDEQSRNVAKALSPAWPKIDHALIDSEMLGVAVDLELEPTPEIEMGLWSLEDLRARYAQGCKAAREVGRDRPVRSGNDPVVFDTMVELDRVVNLP